MVSDALCSKEGSINGENRFPIAEVPKGWKPNPRRVWDAENNKENSPVSKGKGKERAEPQPPKSHAEWKNSLLSADEVCDSPNHTNEYL